MPTLTFDEAIERLHALPEARKPEIAAEIALLLDQADDELLSPEEWAAIEARLDEPTAFTPHEDVVRSFRERHRK